jgi:hypothetical protein
MTTIGRKPAGNDIGYGEMLPNHARGSVFGNIAQNGWLTSFGGRLGRNTGTSSTAQFAVSGFRNNLMGDLLGVSGTFTVSIPMIDNASGSDYTSKATVPVMIGPGAPYGDGSYVALGVRASGASIAHGQDGSGWMMYEDTSITGFADTWTPDNNRPEGKMSLWAEITTNRPPDKPTGLSPVANGRVATSTPTLACDFRDPDEVLPGFTLGQADKVKKYLFEIWNTAKTSRLATSNITTATTGQQTARRVSWTCPTSLSPGSYVARATVYDQFDTPSPVAEWNFAVSAGGTTIPSFAAGVVAGIGNDRYAVTNSTTPGASVLWQSQDGLAMQGLNVRILDPAGAAIVALGGNPTPLRGERYIAKSVANGGTTAFTFAEWAAAGGGFAPLPEGTVCRIETQGLDINGILSPWAATDFITVNAMPDAPTSLTPAAGTSFANFPVLSALITDATNDTSTLSSTFRVRLASDSGNGVSVSGSYNSATGRHEVAASATLFPSGVGAYQWSVAATDAWGKAGAFSAWTAINYVTAPTIVITSPTAEQAYAIGTPTFTWTVDRTQTSKLIVVTEVDAGGNVTGDGQVRHDTYGSAITNIGTPAAQLHNGRRYRLDLTLTTSDGLITTVSRTFSIAYPAPSALTTIAASTLAGPFEHATDPSEWSRISVTWDAATVAQVADVDFGGYVLRRVNLETQQSIVLAHTLTRDARLFIDRTALSGVAYEYRATYLKRVNTFDMVESVPAVAQSSVTLKHSTIVTMDDDDLGCPLRYWTDRSLEWVNDVEVIATWGSKPVIFSGNADSSVLSGSFAVMDDPNGTYTARDVIATVRQIARPRIGDDGYPLPRVVLYRDPKRRLFYVVLTSGGESDEHSSKLGKMDLTFTEIDQQQGVDPWTS